MVAEPDRGFFHDSAPEALLHDIYANVIYETSNNTVYGVPYSDRFGKGPLVNTVYYDGKNVNYWVVGVGAPIGPTDLTGIQLLLLGD